MWRAFGTSAAARVAIVYRIPKASNGSLALNLLFSPVAYLNSEGVQRVICEVIENVQKNCEFIHSVPRVAIVQVVFWMFLAAVVCLKHEGFGEEKEWRAIYTPTFRNSPLMEKSVEVVGGIPQTVYKIPLDANKSAVLADLDFAKIFDRLIIGPTPYAWAIGEALISALVEAGVKDAGSRVVASEIPIRG
jgi:hypothetical protein